MPDTHGPVVEHKWAVVVAPCTVDRVAGHRWVADTVVAGIVAAGTVAAGIAVAGTVVAGPAEHTELGFEVGTVEPEAEAEAEAGTGFAGPVAWVEPDLGGIGFAGLAAWVVEAEVGSQQQRRRPCHSSWRSFGYAR